jgi:hypothetical protein
MRALPLIILLLLVLPAEAALVADINLDRLRQAPEAAEVQARLDAMIPPQARERLALLAEHLGCDPRRDLHRVVVSLPDPGQGAPTIRLVGLPAEAIAIALSMRSAGRSVLGGLTGYPLPDRPHALLVALGPEEALIGRADLLAQEPAPPASLPPIAPTTGLQVRIIPGPHPRHDTMRLVAQLALSGDGLGGLRLEAHAHDQTDAAELAKRYDALKELSTSAAAEALPGLQHLGRLLAATTLTTDGHCLTLAGTMPADLRRAGVDRLLERLAGRLGR